MDFEYEPDSERVRILLSLRKGRGVIERVSDEVLRYFDMSDKWDLIWMFEECAWSMPPTPATAAFISALGLNEEGSQLTDSARSAYYASLTDNLTKRREALSAERGISLRTVMRLEESGAELFDYYLGAVMNRTQSDWLLHAFHVLDEVRGSLVRGGMPIPREYTALKKRVFAAYLRGKGV